MSKLLLLVLALIASILMTSTGAQSQSCNSMYNDADRRCRAQFDEMHERLAGTRQFRLIYERYNRCIKRAQNAASCCHARGVVANRKSNGDMNWYVKVRADGT